MLGFHSQNVLQILENMKPIIFRINVTDEGEITFNKVEGMTNSQAYELMLRNGYGKEGDEPIIPIIRVSYEEVGASYDYGGQYEQKAISTGFRFNNSKVEFHFSHSYSVDGSQPIGEGFVNYDQTRAIVTVTISSTGILIYQYHSLE